MQLDTIVLSKTRQSLRDHYHMLSFFVEPRFHETPYVYIMKSVVDCVDKEKEPTVGWGRGDKREGRGNMPKLNYVHARNVLINAAVIQQLKCC